MFFSLTCLKKFFIKQKDCKKATHNANITVRKNLRGNTHAHVPRLVEVRRWLLKDCFDSKVDIEFGNNDAMF